MKRVDPEALPHFRLTSRDAAIIQTVYNFRALTTPQIAALFFTGEAPSREEINARCKYRLRMLYQYGYLFRDEQPSKLSEGRKPLVYFLDRRGAEFLTHEIGAVISWDKQDNDLSFPFMEHLLATNEIRVAFTLSARKHGWNILTWLDDKTLKSPQMKDTVILKGERGAKLQAAVVPDAYIRLETSEDTYNFCLETDRGTVTGKASNGERRDWGRKVRTYLEYYRSGMYEKRYHTHDLRILTITTGETRLAHLKEITESAQGKGRFWFSTFQRIRESDILTGSLWTIAAREEPAALLA